MSEKQKLPPAMFLGGARALDFLNSVARPVDDIVEWLGNGVDFLSWMKQAGLLTDEDLKTINQNMSPGQLDAAAKEARALRDWFRVFVHEHKGTPLKKHALDQVGPLNRLLAADAVFWQLVPSETQSHEPTEKEASSSIFQLRTRRHWRKAGSLLFLLAEEISKFICSADFKHVKACESGKCTLLFLDQSHRQGRRWCSMAICGNRAKAAAFAERAKAAKKKPKHRRKPRQA